MPSTTREEFNSVTQSGSGASWTNLSNLVYPESGSASASMIATDAATNRVAFALHEGVADVPTGASFDSMSLRFSCKKDGVVSSAAEVDFEVYTSASSFRVYETSDIANNVWITKTVAGDGLYWNFGVATGSGIMDGLRDGSIAIEIRATENNGVAVSAHLDEVTLVITYTTVEGKRGAILIST